jgi:hypothetical protein
VSGPLAGAIGFAAVVALIALRVPVAIAMGIVGTLGYGLVNGWSTLGFVLGRAPFEAVFPIGLSVLPLFILMGVFAAHGGLSRSLYGFVAADPSLRTAATSLFLHDPRNLWHVGGNLVALLTDPTSGLASYFRQWYGLCTFAPSAGGDYFVTVSMNASPAEGAHNRFGLRAGLGSPPDFTTSSLSLYASAKMAIYANVGGGTPTQFYLTRVLPGSAGRTLVLNFFDIGDASSVGTLRVMPPTDSNVAGGLFGGCTWVPPPGNSTGPPWGPFVGITGCLIDHVNQSGYPSFNGQWIQVRISIPDDYTCNATDPKGCWVTINYLFAGGIADTTSWAANLEGDRVRLIK